MNDTDWRLDAACRGMNITLFFPEAGEPAREAKAVCAACPVRQPCLQYALDNYETFGCWGGTTEPERRRLRPRRRGIPTHERQPCGTDAGYVRHRRNLEDACGPCLAAHRLANATRNVA